MKTKTIINALIALLFTASLGQSQPTPPPGKKWQKVENLSDEFNNGFDQSKWQKVLWDYAGTPTKMVAQNSGVSNDNLWIKATLGPDGNRWFQSSRVMSKAQIKYPMYTECRIITAHLSAYNTFWLNNGDINNRDEIDVIENNSRPSCGCQPNFPWQMNSQYFQVINGDTKRAHGNFDNRNLSPNNPKRGVRWNEDYHVVGVWWKDAKNIQFYLDGEPAGNVVSARNFTRNLNLIWDLWTDDVNWLGGVAVKDHLKNNNINTMRVDWVHTYKLVDGGGGAPNDAYRIQSAKSSKWISPIDGTANNGAQIVNHQTGTGNARLWRFVDRGAGYAEMRNVHSGKCLAVPSGSLVNNTKLIQWNCNGNDDQLWKRVSRSNGRFAFQNKKSGKCIDLTNGNTNHNTQFQQYTCDPNNENQLFWILNPTNRTDAMVDLTNSTETNRGDFNTEGAILYLADHNTLHLQGFEQGMKPISVIDMHGRTLLTVNKLVQKDGTAIDISSLKHGAYILKVGHSTYRFIKR